MITISDILQKYRGKIDFLDLELIIAHVLKKNREFVLTHPEFAIAKNCESRIMNYANRRMKNEPLAYILGKKEFYGIEFKANKNVLIPRPETEMMVDLVSHSIKHGTWNKKDELIIVDIGTGSGNIIIAIAKKIKQKAVSGKQYAFFGTDISTKALTVAKYNAKIHKVDKKIKFLNGNLLTPVIKKCSMLYAPCSMIITANLPYLSPKIYGSCSQDIKNYEPKSALISHKDGLCHYDNLLNQITKLGENCSMLHVSCFMEISPEQKTKISKLIKKYFPSASWRTKILFHKDLSGRWRMCQLEIFNS